MLNNETKDNLLKTPLGKYMLGEIFSLGKKFEQKHEKMYVITGFQVGSMKQTIGRLVQVRYGVGEFGTDIILLRESDGSISQHSNQCFWLIDDSELIGELDDLFKDVAEEFPEHTTYRLFGKKDPKTGFIINKNE